jgi:hypothetical protein
LTVTALDWLPLSALNDISVVDPIWNTLERWSDLWFGDDAYRRGTVKIHTAGSRAALGNMDWRAIGNDCRIGWNETKAVDLAKSALAAPSEKLSLFAADSELLMQFAAELLKDLGNKLAVALRQSDAAAAGDTAAKPFTGHGGLIFAAEQRDGLPELRLALPASALVPLRKAAIGSGFDLRVSDERLVGALRDEAIDFVAVLGTWRR